MRNQNYPTIGLKASYCLPFVSFAELVTILLIIVIPWLSNWLDHFVLLSLLSGLLNRLKLVLVGLTVFLTIGWLVMLIMTIIYQHNNGFYNYWLSWVQTIDIRNFAKISPKIVQVKENSVVKNQKDTNPTEQAFNNAIKGWYIDISDNNLIVWLLMPISLGSQVIFDQNLLSIENKIKQDNPDFTFSPAERVGNYYRISATKF